MGLFFNNAMANTTGLPQASAIAANVDHLHDFLVYVSLFFLFLVTMLMIVLVHKYHRSKKGRTTEYILDNHFLEALWTVGPLILMLFIFGWGYKDYIVMKKNLPNVYEINVVGKQWMWNFEYTNGRKTLNELYLPINRNIKLIMTSDDVLHSFFLPNHRVKQDVVPGLYTTLEFNTTMLGDHPIYCAEYCGTGHSDMLGTVHVLEQADFEKWLQTGKTPKAAPGTAMASDTKPGAQIANKSMAEKGADLFKAKGCFACHSTDGSPKVGPTIKGIFGHEVELQDGKKVMVDENYIRESLMEPNAKIVKGFAPAMPTFKGQLSEEETSQVIAFIKSLK